MKLFDPKHIISANWKFGEVLILGWSSTIFLYVFWFGLWNREKAHKQTNKPSCCLLITYMAPFIPLIEIGFCTISVPCCTEFQEKRPRDIDNSGFSIPALCLASLWQCPNCTLGFSAFGFGGSLALLTGWNCADSITLNSTDRLVFQQEFRRLLYLYQCSVFLLHVSWNVLLPKFE